MQLRGKNIASRDASCGIDQAELIGTSWSIDCDAGWGPNCNVDWSTGYNTGSGTGYNTDHGESISVSQDVGCNAD